MRPGALVVVATGSSATLVLTAYLAEIRANLDQPLIVLMTHSAQRFMRPEAIAWFADEVLTSDSPSMNPVEVALSAESIVVLPASAHTLAAAALGLASTPALTILLAAPKPCMWFPHMNKTMWDKPAIQRHVATLRDSGETVVEPEACEVYEIWRAGTGVGVSMPGPEQAAAIIHTWRKDPRPSPPGAPAAEAAAHV